MPDPAREFNHAKWKDTQHIETAFPMRCAYCDREVGASEVYGGPRGVGVQAAVIYICPVCRGPNAYAWTTYGRYPEPVPGAAVRDLPEDIATLYREIRAAIAAEAPTAAALTARTLLMHVAVDKGADAGKTFQFYVDWLDTQHFIPPGGKPVVDHIRETGNSAGHTVTLATDEEVRRVLRVVEMLLRNVYEFPAALNP
jgi:hypothetical protein